MQVAGGCLCGQVRYTAEVADGDAYLCHCRMCQKAVGGPFAVIVPVAKAGFRVTRGEIAWFESSAVARRGFCRDCGTPLIFDYPHDPGIGVLAGCLDRPDLVPPVVQYGVESRVVWFHGLPELPGDEPTFAKDPQGLEPRILASNRQHPDHDTEAWPPRA